MAREIPAAPRIYTTTYDNFRGVDFTNDSTNVWRKRSPSAVNMLPDASGRPFKRKGWEILISQEQLCEQLGVASCSINKCAWFELAGRDHLAIFTDVGVVFYNGEFTAQNKDYDCYMGFDRSFFFEGGGTAAFYIYGNFKVWRYEADFQLHDVTPILTVPRVLVSTDADGTGTVYESYNLLGHMISMEFRSMSLFTYWGSDGLVFSVSDGFTTGKTQNDVPLFRWSYNGSSWQTEDGGVAFDSTNINVVSQPNEGDEIVILYIYGVMLANNVSQNALQGEGQISVRTSVSTQFDHELEIVTATETLTTENCKLFTDMVADRTGSRAWIQFGKMWNEIVTGEDFIKVTFPSDEVIITEYPKSGEESKCLDNGIADLIEV